MNQLFKAFAVSGPKLLKKLFVCFLVLKGCLNHSACTLYEGGIKKVLFWIDNS